MLAEELRGIDALGHDAVVITAGQRLARTVRRYIESVRLERDEIAWREPQVVTYESWLRTSFTQCALRTALPMPKLLSSAQALAVWRDCCLTQINAERLEIAGVSAIAKECQRAFVLLQSWQLEDSALQGYAETENTLFFAQCLARFRARQQREGWITDAEIGATLLAHRSATSAGLPSTRWFAGFSQLTPVQRALAEQFAIDFRCATVSQSRTQAVSVQRFDSLDEELIAAGSWARERLQAAPEARLAIVVMNLDQALAQKRRRVLEGLDPDALGIDSEVGIEVSVAQSLAQYPAVDVAMQVLQWACSSQRFASLSRVLRAPWLADSDNSHALEVVLRELPDHQWSVRMFADWSRQEAMQPEWLDCVLALYEQRQEVCALSLWASRLAATFESMGWLRDSAPDSAAFQLLSAFYDQLNTLASMDSILSPVNLRGATAVLQRLVGDTVFQPQAQFEHVLLCGPLELAGLRLDGVWIAGCNTTQWPPAGQAATLLPAALQRDCQMPDASAQQSNEFWRRQFDLLLTTGDSRRISCARREGESELLPSPLIRHQTVTDAAPPVRSFGALLGSIDFDVVADDVGVFNGSRVIKGGFSALGRQSGDPFGAMILGRWGPRVLREPTVGIDASLRGSLIHASLECFYKQHTSREAIAALARQELNEHCRIATAAAFAGRFVFVDRLTRLLLRREEERACQLIGRFVSGELQRSDFSIHAIEKTIRLTLSGLKIDIRVDRIDQTENGLLIVDYKTGRPGPLLRADNIAETFPQLACYLIGVEGTVEGIALAWINHATLDWHALGVSTLKLPNGKVTHLDQQNMADIRSASQDALTPIAAQFVAGDLEWSADLFNNRSTWLGYAPITRIVEHVAGC